jgi:hypothetical protein
VCPGAGERLPTRKRNYHHKGIPGTGDRFGN